MHKRLDPVTMLLGKDVAQLVYKFVHMSVLQELHKEYQSRLKRILSHGALCFYEPNTYRREFLFNYRSNYDTNIASWAVDRYDALPRQLPNQTFALLPNNYWHTNLPKVIE